jgi:hypothetical protein
LKAHGALKAHDFDGNNKLHESHGIVPKCAPFQRQNYEVQKKDRKQTCHMQVLTWPCESSMYTNLLGEIFNLKETSESGQQV